MAEASDGECYPPPKGDAGSGSSSAEDGSQEGDGVSLPDDASIMDIEKEGGAFCSTRHTLCWMDIPADNVKAGARR